MPGIGPPTTSDNFKLSSSDSGFTSRSNDIFSAIDSVQVHENPREEPLDINESPTNSMSGISRQRNSPYHCVEDPRNSNSEFPFRRPQNRPRRSARVPDFTRNPQNYTRYDLSSVESTSNRENTATALSFIQELRKRKEQENEKQSSSDYEERTNFSSENKLWNNSKSYVRRKHVYKEKAIDSIADNAVKPSCSKTCPESIESTSKSDYSQKSTFIGGKLTMPEYVVGQSKVKCKSNKDEKINVSCDTLTLDHLNEEESDTIHPEVPGLSKMNSDNQKEESDTIHTEVPGLSKLNSPNQEEKKTSSDDTKFKKKKQKSGIRQRKDSE